MVLLWIMILLMMTMMTMSMSLMPSQKRTLIDHMRGAHEQATDENPQNMKRSLKDLLWNTGINKEGKTKTYCSLHVNV